MGVKLTDAEIAALIAETKPLPDDYRERVRTKPKRGHRERELDLVGAQGSEFRVILRESSYNPLDFSVILAWLPPKSTSPFRLRRYNGKSHVHRATERYQRSGLREDSFAEPTTRYQDFASALQCLVQECGFQLPPNPQPGLFDTEGAP